MESPKERERGDQESTEPQESCQCSEAEQDLTACLLREAECAEAQLRRAVEAHEERVQGMMADVLQRMEEARWTFVAEFLSQRAMQRRLRQRLQEEEEDGRTASGAPRHPPASAQDACPGWGMDQEEECAQKRTRREHTPSNWDPEYPGPHNRCFLGRQEWPNDRDNNHCMYCWNDHCVHFRDKSNSVSKGFEQLYNQHLKSDYCDRFDEIRDISANAQDIYEYMKNRDSFCISHPFSHASTQTGDCKEVRDESTCTLLFRRQRCSCKRCTKHLKDQPRHCRCIHKKNRSFRSDGRSEYTRKNDTSVAYGPQKQEHAHHQCCPHRKECRAFTPCGEACGDRGDFCRYLRSQDVNRRLCSDPTTSCSRSVRCARRRRPDCCSRSVGQLPDPPKGFGSQEIRFPADVLSKRQWSKCSMSSTTSRKRRSRRKHVDSHATCVATTVPHIPPPSSCKVEATDRHRISRMGATERAAPAGGDDVQRRLVALIDARDALLAAVARDSESGGGGGGGGGSVVDESLFAVAAVNAQIRRLLSCGDARPRPPPTSALAPSSNGGRNFGVKGVL